MTVDSQEPLLIPLLQRLGFSLVFNYHGRAEFGKDLIFAEVDRPVAVPEPQDKTSGKPK